MIGALPPTYVTGRDALHRLAVYVMSPARYAQTREITLFPAPGGFGTPVFGEHGTRIRTDGTDLVVERDGTAAREPITSLNAAGRLAGIAPDVAQQDAFDVPPHGDLDAPLPVDAASAAALADWYAFAFDVLDEVRREARPGDDATDHVRMWPEHFDAAFDMGDEAAGLRGTFGASPGDRWSDEPYLYVTVWAGPPDDAFWNAEGFRGAWMRHSELRAAGDARAAATAFLRDARRRVLAY